MKKVVNNFKVASNRKHLYTVRVLDTETLSGYSLINMTEAEAAEAVEAEMGRSGPAQITVWLGTAKTGRKVRSFVVGRTKQAPQPVENVEEKSSETVERRRERRQNKRLSDAEKHERRMKMCKDYAKATGRKPWEHPRFGMEYLETSQEK